MDDEAVGADEFQMIGAGGQGQIQFLKSDSPEAVAERVFVILNTIDTSYLRLGYEFFKIYHRSMYIQYGFSTFDECMAEKFNVSRERADRVRRVWTKFIKELLLKTEQLDGVRFQRAFIMLPIVNSENALELIERAKTTRSTKAFNAHIDLLKGKPKAIAHARNTAHSIEEKTTEHTLPTTSASGRLQVAEIDEEERPTKVTFNLYPSQREIIDAAIAEVTKNKTGGSLMAPNEALAHVALGFLSERLTQDQRPNAQVRFYLNWFERVYGGKFVWITSPEAASVLTKAIEDSPSLFPQQGKTTINPEEDGSDEHPDDDSRGPEAEEGEGQADRG